jgi:hypothetical protein
VQIAIFYTVGLAMSVALFMVASHYSLQLLDGAPDLPADKGADASSSQRATFVRRESNLEAADGAKDAPAGKQRLAGGMGGLMRREVTE